MEKKEADIDLRNQGGEKMHQDYKADLFPIKGLCLTSDNIT